MRGKFHWAALAAACLLAACGQASLQPTAGATEPLVETPTFAPPTTTPEFAPFGDQDIVYSTDATGDGEIYVINSDGSNLQRVTNRPNTDELFPQWSPDGKILMFLTSNRDGADEFVTVLSGTGELLWETKLPMCNREGGPVWSPDGSWIVLYCWEKLIFFKPDGSNLHEIPGTEWSDPALIHWSPDSQLLGIRTSGDLKISDMEGNVIEVDTGWIGRRSAADISYGFDFSPDSHEIAFSYAEIIPGELDFEVGPSTINVLTLSTLGSRTLIPAKTGIEVFLPQYIARDSILVVGLKTETDGALAQQIYTFDLTSSELVNHTQGVDTSSYALSPSGKSVAYILDADLWVLDLQTNESRLITSLDFDGPIYWMPDEKGLLLYNPNSVQNIVLYIVKLEDGSVGRIEVTNKENGVYLDIR